MNSSPRDSRVTVHRPSHVLAVMAIILGSWSVGAAACTTAAWSLTTDPGAGNLQLSGPLETTNATRFSGECALEVIADGSDVAFVEDQTPSSEDRYNARFYLFAGNGLAITSGGAIHIFEALDATSAKVLAVNLGGTATAGVFNASLTAGGTSTTAVSVSTGWHSLEVRWLQGAATLVVDGIAQPTLTTGSSAQTIDTARLGLVGGALDAASGMFLVDAFESRRSQFVGGLLDCDANDDAAVNVIDIQAIANEILSPAQSSSIGQPDCNRDGAIDSVDVERAVNVILGH